MSQYKNAPARSGDPAPDEPPLPGAKRSKFGAASEGWDAYNNWLDRVRRQPGGRSSRQAVIAKALYSLSSYKNWAEKARGAFDEHD